MAKNKVSVERFDKTKRYCQAIKVGDALHIGGQCAYDSFGQDIRTQAKEILGRIDGFLSRAGMSRECVVIAHVYLSDRADYAGFNEVWDDWISPEATPTRVCVISNLVHPGCLVEVSVYACDGDITDQGASAHL